MSAGDGEAALGTVDSLANSVGALAPQYREAIDWEG